ncbi:MAG: bifunctional hydroxymethylpyrimidine kinase/phosphomethylpyrimidine kinase, partial [Pseudomonadota bacterium]
LGQPLQTAVTTAHGYLQAAINTADHLHIGSGHGPVHHFHAQWPR